MNFKSLFGMAAAVTVALLLYPSATRAQEAQVQPARTVRPSWHTMLAKGNISENGFRSRLKIRTEVRPDGAQVAVVTNVSRAPLFYEAYGPTSPRWFIEERQDEKWIANRWNWCGTGLSTWEIKPGASRTFPLAPGDGKKVRHWVIFQDKPWTALDKPLPPNTKRSVMLLDENGTFARVPGVLHSTLVTAPYDLLTGR